jgi:hypothetical protein
MHMPHRVFVMSKSLTAPARDCGDAFNTVRISSFEQGGGAVVL